MSAAAMSSPCVPAAVHCRRWAEVSVKGRIWRERRPDGKPRWRIDFGVVDGVRVRLAGIQTEAGVVAFASRAQAEKTLARIQGDMLARNLTLRQALGLWSRRRSPQDTVGARVGAYLAHVRELVAVGKRSPTTLRELERYAVGHWGGMAQRSIYGLTFGDVEDWQKALAAGRIAPKTQANISNAFRAFLRWAARRDPLVTVPDFPAVEVPEYAPRIISLEEQAAVLAEIPWPVRGAALVAASEALRVGEIRACDVGDYQSGRLLVSRAVQGARVGAPIGPTKNRSGQWRQLWHEGLLEWIEWRLAQATPEARLRGEVALFWNPRARHVAKRHTQDSLERAWDLACDAAGVARVSFQQGTRHATLTALGAELPERMLQAFSRHRDGRSLARYSKPVPTPAAVVRALRGKRDE